MSGSGPSDIRNAVCELATYLDHGGYSPHQEVSAALVIALHPATYHELRAACPIYDERGQVFGELLGFRLDAQRALSIRGIPIVACAGLTLGIAVIAVAAVIEHLNRESSAQGIARARAMLGIPLRGYCTSCQKVWQGHYDPTEFSKCCGARLEHEHGLVRKNDERRARQYDGVRVNIDLAALLERALMPLSLADLDRVQAGVKRVLQEFVGLKNTQLSHAQMKAKILDVIRREAPEVAPSFETVWMSSLKDPPPDLKPSPLADGTVHAPGELYTDEKEPKR